MITHKALYYHPNSLEESGHNYQLTGATGMACNEKCRSAATGQRLARKNPDKMCVETICLKAIIRMSCERRKAATF